MQGVNFAAPMKSVAVRASDGTATAVTLEHVKGSELLLTRNRSYKLITYMQPLPLVS